MISTVPAANMFSSALAAKTHNWPEEELPSAYAMLPMHPLQLLLELRHGTADPHNQQD